MKLAKVHIREFKSVRDSNSFEIGDVTCLVGKNESGKTALLQALYRLNPVVPEHGTFDVTEDYPRSEVEDYQYAVEQKKRSHATVVTASFLLEAKDKEEAEKEFGHGLFSADTATLTKGYDNILRPSLDLDQAAIVRHLIGNSGLPPELATAAGTKHSLRDLSSFLNAEALKQENAVKKANAQAEKLEDAATKAHSIDEANKLAETEAAKQLRSRLTELLKGNLQSLIWEKYLKKLLPLFFYFDEYYQMEGQVNIQRLKQRQAENKLQDADRPMLGLIELARMNLEALLNPQNTQVLISKLEGASNHLSKQILKYWSQNRYISVKFDIRPALAGDPEGMREGTNLWGLVSDDAHKVTTRLGTRSRGFIWFFSFLAWFSQQRKRGTPLILLLDEPGLVLHAKGQADLLRYIEEELKPHHQTIYSTHSPFMVDPKHFERVRIVRDRSMDLKKEDDPLPPDEAGTKVLADVLDADEGSIFPLQGALAYDITQTLFVGPNSLIIEGVSDMYYIEGMSGVLQRSGRPGLDNRWTLTPVGGSDKVPTFVALFSSQKGLNLAALIDFQKKDQQKIENMFKQKLLKQKQVLTFAEFTKTVEADIEDMFDVGFYLELVNQEYKSDLPAPIREADLQIQHPRIVVRLDEYFKAHPLNNRAVFNHYRPARYFAEHVHHLELGISTVVQERFDIAFKALNALL